MTTQLLNHKSGYLLSARPFLTWRIVQTAARQIDARYFSFFGKRVYNLSECVVNLSARE
ncbi:MAG: hypothetical protein ACHQIM_09930 [Sphingobacteriales bacterium]